MAKLELNIDALIEQLSEEEGKDFRQKDIAELAEIDEGQLSRYINNRTSSINLEALGKLFKAFGIEPGPMFRWTDD